MDENKKKIIRNSFFVICTILMFIFVSYAVFAFSQEGTEENKITTGTLLLTLDETASSGISLENAIPVTDSDGMLNDPYIFTIENTGTLNANYQVVLENDAEKYNADGCNNNKLPWQAIKYAFSKDGSTPEVALLSGNDGIFDTGLLAPGEKKTYTLRLWISENAQNEIMGTHFHGKIKVKAIQEGHTNYDTGE